MSGRHRYPPPEPRTDWRWHTIAALAGLGILAPPVWLWADAVAPDARGAGVHGVSVSTTAREVDPGPLELPTIGDLGMWTPPETTATPSAPAHRPIPTPRATRRPSRPSQPASGALVATTGQSVQTVTPAPQPVTTTTAAAPPTTVAAATSATPTGEPVTTPTVTPTPTVTVDATAGVTG